MAKRLTDSRIFREFRDRILPEVTGKSWNEARVTVKMKLFSNYSIFLAEKNLITRKRVAILDTNFVINQLKLG